MATSYLAVFLLLLPVFLQIIFPLIMLVGWMVFRGLLLLFGERQAEVPAETKADEELQLSRI